MTSLALCVSSVLLASPPSASANPAATGLVIREVYGAGGNAGAPFNADFVELYNPTGAAIELRGMSLQYRSAAGNPGGSPFALVGSVPSNTSFLVRMSATGAVGAALSADLVAGPAIAMASDSGQVLLVDGVGVVSGSGNFAGAAGVIDMVGYGTAATSYETGPTANASTANSVNRSIAGGDSDNNSTDFALAAPSPQSCSCAAPYTTTPATIAEVQGDNTAVSPFYGQGVSLQGVVTAVYSAASGFNGFYLQTAGSGGATDATPGAADAVFVFGNAAMSINPVVGDHLAVTGPVVEFAGTTEVVPTAAADVTRVASTPDPVTALAAAYPTTEAAREAHEGELLAPTDTFTVTNTFATNQFAEIGLATGTKPLIQPTDVARPGTAEVDAIAADNAARGVVLDDGASTNFLSNATTKAIPLPWLSIDNPVRVGARATFAGPVVLEYRNNAWKFQPTTPVTDAGSATVTFQNTRTEAPQPVGGDLRLATFNVLNYFNTTGEAWVAAGAGRTCTYFTDRDNARVTNNVCAPDGPRGAAQDDDLARQQAKIVAAINALGADVVSLEEIENSVKLGEADRDDAVSALVTALNTAAGSDRWAFAPSPSAADLPALAEQDVIRTAFIYNPNTVEAVGAPRVLVGDADFANAREPLAQAFKRKGGRDRDGFVVAVNHFKSKGDASPPATGDNANGLQGAFNGDRTRQAASLVEFVNAFAADRGLARVFLTGDFNSYTEEDPMHVLYDAGFTKVESDTPGEASYSFSGLSGSLDHVLANDAALARVTGADIWDINASESVAFEYSRHNYNVTNFYQPNPFRASDHNPEVVGIRLRDPAGPVQLNLLGVNDFHGRINTNTVKWAGTVEKLTADAGDEPTLMVGAGDLIGASEFPSAVAQDQPTIDVMNALGLDASAVGNHEFDRGWLDLRDRVIGPVGSRNAKWEYLGANVYATGTTDPVLPEYALFDLDGISVAVVGAVTEETSTLVSPGGITQIDFGNPVDAVNRVAGELSDGDPANGEAQVIVASFHAGAQQGVGSNYAAEVAKGGEFAQMANLDPSVDVIFNGHTHQAYAWDAPIPGGAGATRPIIQTGQYADNVGQVTLSVDPTTGNVVTYSVRNVARLTTADAELVATYPRVAQVKTIVDAALAQAAVVGNQPVGSQTADLTRAFSNGSYVNGRWVAPIPRTEDRGSESTLGDLVGNALRDGIPAEMGTADLGIVNPGGLRADLIFAGNTAQNPANGDGVITYAEANGVLPFVNNIWLIELTGAQLKAVLEQQWQTNPGGPTPARPFLALGLSDNVKTTLDPTKPEGSRVTSVTIDGVAIHPAATYTVSTFSFLGTGGDNFRAFRDGVARDTGLVDRDLWISYLQGHANVAPDFVREHVYESGMPAVVYAGQHVELSLSKLNLTSLGSPENTTLRIVATDETTTVVLGTIPVTAGSASVEFDVPAAFAGGGFIELTARPSQTVVRIPIGVRGSATVDGSAEPIAYGSEGTVVATVSPASATGTVELYRADLLLGSGTIVEGSAEIVLAAGSLEPGAYRLRLEYSGDLTHSPAVGHVDVVVTKAAALVSATATPTTVKVKKGTTTVAVNVSAEGVSPTGSVAAYVNGSVVASADLVAGAATLTVGPFASVGVAEIEVRYLGDAHVATGTDAVSVTVVKNRPRVNVVRTPAVVKRNATRAVFTVTVTAPGLVATGTVQVKVDGALFATKTLVNGTTSVRLNPFGLLGSHDIKLIYSGDASLERVAETRTLDVVP